MLIYYHNTWANLPFKRKLYFCMARFYMSRRRYDQTNKMTSAPSEDSDQPGQPPSLIPHEETLGPQLPIVRTAKTLIRLGGCPG